MWVQSLLQELSIKIDIPVLLCDNLSIVNLSHNPVLHARTKNVELDAFFVRDQVLSKKVQVQHIPGHSQLADVLTKPLPSTQFLEFRPKLTVRSLTAEFEGG